MSFAHRTIQIAAQDCSSACQSVDGAMRADYGSVLAITLLRLGPHGLLKGEVGFAANFASWLRCLWPVAAVMEVLGHSGVGTHGLGSTGGAVPRFTLIAGVFAAICAMMTIRKLGRSPLDKARPAGTMTQDRTTVGQLLRRLISWTRTADGAH